GRFSEFLGLRVDAVHDHRDIHRRVFILRETRKATLLGNSPGLRLHLRIRFVGIRAVVELRHILGGGHEALNMLLGELDLLYLLRNGRAGMKQSESQKRGEQRTEKASARGHGVSLSNERHGWSSISIHRCDMTPPNRCGSEGRRFFSITKRPRAGEWISLTPPRLPFVANATLRPRAFSVAVCWCAVLVVPERKRPHTRHYWRGIHHDAHGQSGARHDPASSPRPTAPKSYSLTADQSWGSYSVPA